MRNSGVEWIGEIPDGWLTRPLRFVAACNPSTSPYDGESQYVALENVEPWTGRLVDIDTDATVDSTVSSFDGGQVLFGKLRPYLGKVIRPSFAGVCTTELLPITPCDMNRDFLYWCLANLEFIKTVNAGTYGVKMPRTSWTQMGRISVPVPPAEEQARIAKTLDDATDELDSAISTLTDQLDVLRHYRSSLIHEAVTKGLDPSAPMRPSGVEWIGSIPEGWAVKRLKWVVTSFSAGTSVRAASYPAEGEEVGVLSLSAVFGGQYNPNANKTVDSDELGRVSCPVRKGSLLVSRCNTSELVGLPAYVDVDSPNLYLPDKIWQIGFDGDVCAKFAYYALTSSYARQYCAVFSVGSSSSMQNLASDDLLAMHIAYPVHLEEQQAIVSYLDERCGHVDHVIDLKERQLDVLRRRRQSLIYEYVTGKRRVR